MTKKIFIFLFEGYSDWEIAYISPGFNKSEEFDLIYFSKDGDPVTSMGGLYVSPSASLSEINIDDVDMLILPGGAAWEMGENKEIEALVNRLFNERKTIAAICAATTYLGEEGLLDNLKHTSNALFYLKAFAPLYSGESHYVDSLAVTDGHIITANGAAPIEFAREIFTRMKLYKKDEIEKWFQLFKNGVWSE